MAIGLNTESTDDLRATAEYWEYCRDHGYIEWDIWLDDIWDNGNYLNELHRAGKRYDHRPETVKQSEFGCKNCLWEGCECVYGSKLDLHDGNCCSYTYFD